MKKIFIIFTLTFFTQLLFSQEKKTEYKVAAIGFYNVENLYDTLDQENVADEEFLPRGKKNYTSKVYHDKLDNLADVISRLGKEVTPDGLAIMGMAEIENKSVVEDLVHRPKLIDKNYQVIQYDSPDLRGIDVALIYQPKYFTPISSRPIALNQKDEKGRPRLTRDILYVKGLLDGDTIHILVNHWPSRRGGEAASAPYRNDVALKCKMLSDTIMAANPEAKILIMGDLNDDPVSPSCAEVIGARADKKMFSKALFTTRCINFTNLVSEHLLTTMLGIFLIK